MEDSWLQRVKRLHALASTGLFFGDSEFDKERYQEIADIAEDMLSDLGQVPLRQLQGLFPDFAEGYATPKVDVRAAVLRESKVLMVREKTDGLWTLPGGYADVGYSAGENAAKEVREESGLKVEPGKLYAVFHKAKHEYTPDVRDFYKFYFLCHEIGEQAQEPVAGMETLDAGFFSLDQLPPLSEGRSILRHIELAFAHRDDPLRPADFD